MEAIESFKAELADAHRATHATDISLQNVIAELDGLKAQQSPDFAALRKLYVNLTNADNVQDGINVNGKHCTDEMMDEFERILERQSPAVAVPEFNGWYCAQCQCGVDPSEVTYQETHTTCGRYITDDEPPTSPQRVTEQDAREIAIQFFYWWHNQPGTNTMQGFGDWLEFEGRALLSKLNGVAE